VSHRPSLVYLSIGVVSWPLMKFLFRLRAKGLENLPHSGGFVLAANHISNLDPWPLGIPLFPRRFLRFMAKSELYWWPLGPILTACGAFPVRRGQRDLEAIEHAVELAREGHVIAMFPEGTRRRKGLRKKWQPEWHAGAARIAIEAEVPLIPAGIRGTDELRRLGPLRIVYGEPIALDGLDQDGATERLRTEIERLEATL
jgi:1-acyl-sn-glycerol-3-phosphate acyltransferase